jgi:hypothetical protein
MNIDKIQQLAEPIVEMLRQENPYVFVVVNQDGVHILNDVSYTPIN